MSNSKPRFSFGKKMYLFVTITVLVVALGIAGISFLINAGQIDQYYKQLTSSCAKCFASFVDADFFRQLRTVAESDEYQELRDGAEEADDESAIEEYLTEKGLWEE